MAMSQGLNMPWYEKRQQTKCLLKCLLVSLCSMFKNKSSKIDLSLLKLKQFEAKPRARPNRDNRNIDLIS